MRKNANLLKTAAKEAGEQFYFEPKPCPQGHVGLRYTSDGKCKICVSDFNRRRREDPDFRDAASERHRKWRKENLEAALSNSREWYENNKERHLENANRWAKENLDAKREIQRRYDRSVAHLPEVRRHRALKARVRNRRVRRATPAWVDKNAIFEIYANCPEDMVVDHIVPLNGADENGRNVCGLHVPWNLQYLTIAENTRKLNHWPWPGCAGLAFVEEINYDVLVT